MVLRITVENPAGAVKASTQAEDRAILVWDGFYTPGDRIRFTVPEAGKEWRIRVDDAVEEAQVLLTGTELVYEVPCGDAALPYNPNAFGSGRHLLTLRAATAGEMEAVRNLAANPIDQHDATDCFPHAHANAETRGEAVFFARNAIDGVTANTSHGVWPFATWGNDGRDDAEITVEFGRPVDLEEVALVTRADFPHDNWWVNGKLTFSNGHTMQLPMEKSDQPHRFAVAERGVEWVKLSDLVKADDPSPWAALVQIEAYGRVAR
ncbi:carbohydrate-binding protein [Bifidobacterium oedipodis]|uniref:Carbohydrate-binding protein n=1 Tax=Bifidobacterium oedipodis TaxID=2675322 RepID=A0A7Y0EPN3_9BIFI|nr:carbohydrate-binding protein [Bifidobacterium sp. DSM 109957]NMM94131.1 carbohydrate-binding protein [Bifidobacterium sp. DSM 109957]